MQTQFIFLMKVKVRRLGEPDKLLEIPKGASIAQLLKKLKIDKDSVVVRIGKRIATEDGKITSPEVEIINVVSGG